MGFKILKNRFLAQPIFANSFFGGGGFICLLIKKHIAQTPHLCLKMVLCKDVNCGVCILFILGLVGLLLIVT